MKEQDLIGRQIIYWRLLNSVPVERIGTIMSVTDYGDNNFGITVKDIASNIQTGFCVVGLTALRLVERKHS